MPGRLARSGPRPSFGLAAVPVTVGTSRLSCGNAVKREYSRRFGSHLGNPGLDKDGADVLYLMARLPEYLKLGERSEVAISPVEKPGEFNLASPVDAFPLSRLRGSC